MKQTKWVIIALSIALLALPAAAYDDADYKAPEDDSKVEFTMGYQGSSVDDELFRVAEYEVSDPNPIVGLVWSSSPYSPSTLTFGLDRMNSDQMSGYASFDLDRKIQVNATMDSLLHRLDHDPVSNLQAVSGIKTTRSTDLEPGADYQIRHRTYAIDADILHPDVPGLSFRIGFRERQREGMKQALNTSHCTSCHTVAQGREIDSSTTDYSVGMHVARGRVDFDYQLLGRQYQEDGTTPTMGYEVAYRPSGGGPTGQPFQALLLPFNDRVWYQDATLPYNEVPSIQRTEHRVKIRAGLKEADSINFTLVQSSTENRVANLKYNFGGFRGRYVWRPKDKVKVNFYAQRDDIENDTVFVDLLEMNGLTTAPMTNYGTFEGWRQAVDDPTLVFNSFTRYSSKDRTEDRLGVDAYWRRSKGASLRLGYRYRLIDRDHVILADGTGETASHRLKAAWNQRMTKKLRWNNSLTYTMTDNPYVNVDGGWRMFGGYRDQTLGLVVGEAPSPKSPNSLQYYQLHALRMANLGNAATDDLKLRSNLTWSPKESVSFSANLRYRDAENDELNLSDWEQEKLGFGAHVWVAAADGFHLTLGVDHEEQETDALIAIPLMDG